MLSRKIEERPRKRGLSLRHPQCGEGCRRLTADEPCGCQLTLRCQGARTLDAVNVVYVEREPSRLEQLASQAGLLPDEARALLRARIARP